jgi:hypothetical protein
MSPAASRESWTSAMCTELCQTYATSPGNKLTEMSLRQVTTRPSSISDRTQVVRLRLNEVERITI